MRKGHAQNLQMPFQLLFESIIEVCFTGRNEGPQIVTRDGPADWENESELPTENSQEGNKSTKMKKLEQLAIIFDIFVDLLCQNVLIFLFDLVVDHVLNTIIALIMENIYWFLDF